MGFAPYTLHEYASKIEEEKRLANLEKAQCWDNVQDFRWHKTQASPNWYIIPIEQRRNGREALIEHGESLKLKDQEKASSLSLPTMTISSEEISVASKETQSGIAQKENDVNEDEEDEL
jgi:hypothetical protein